MKINNNNLNFCAKYIITGEKEKAIYARNRILKEKQNSDYLQFELGAQRVIFVATDEDAIILKKKKASKSFNEDSRKVFAKSNKENIFKDFSNFLYGSIENIRLIKGRTLNLVSNPIFPINVDANNNERFVGTTTYHNEEFLDGSWKNFGSSGKLNSEGLPDGTKIDYKDGVEKFFPDGSRVKYYPTGEIKEVQDKNGITKFYDLPQLDSKLQAIKTPTNTPDEYEIIEYFYNKYNEVSFVLSSNGKIGVLDENSNINWISPEEIDELDVDEKTKTLMRDRLQYTKFTDGTIISARSNGQIVKKELSNHAILTYQNGKPIYKNDVVKKVETFYSDTGEVLFEAKKHTKDLPTSKNGKVISKNEISFDDEFDRSFRFVKIDGKWLRRDFYADGSSITKDMDGKIYDKVDKDGTMTEYLHDIDKIIITHPDGCVDIYCEGELVATTPSDKLIAHSDDYYTVYYKESDADGIFALYNKNDNFIGELFPNGTRTYYYGNRHQATDFPDGTREKYDGRGRRIVLVAPDGRIDKFNEITRRLASRIMPDGTKFIYDYDEDISKEIKPDGTIVNYFYGRDVYGWKALLFKLHSNGKIESENGVVDEEKRTITFTKETGLKVVYDEFGTLLNAGLLEEGAIEKKYPSAAFPGYRRF